TESTGGHIVVDQFIFDGTGSTHQMRVVGVPSGGRAVRIHHNTFNGLMSAIRAETIRGVVDHNTFDAGPYTGRLITTEALQVKTTANFESSWSTNSTMGTNDTDGEHNLYFEDNTIIHHHTEALDADDESRLVVRYNTFRES